MSDDILILPVGGSASRMIGLPKFMLPCSESETLIERHVTGALLAGYKEVHIITKSKYFDLIQSYFQDRSIRATIHSLNSDTKTMSETLKAGLEFIPHMESLNVTVGLADTAFHGMRYEDIYRGLLESASQYALALFQQREDQFGKLGQVNIDVSGRVIDMKDKDANCTYPSIWGIAKVPGEFIGGLNVNDAHIGIGIEKLLKSGVSVSGLSNDADYYDCGTFNEYLMYLNR